MASWRSIKNPIARPSRRTGSSNDPRRVVTLIASATEIVSALGCGARLIGRSHECDYPPEVVKLPALTAPKLKAGGTSGEIDREIRELVERGLSVYQVDADLLRALAPDLIITQDHCEVCAVSLSDVEAATCAWIGVRPQIVSLRPNSLDDVYEDVRRVASALGVAETGEQLILAMRQRLEALRETTRALTRPRVAFIEWGEPLMSGGNWMPTLIEIAGGANLFGTAGGKSEVMAWGELIAADPDVIIIAPCGYDLDASRREHAALARHPGWAELLAVREARVFCADGNAFFNRPGPRLVETAEIIAEILHPEMVDFEHEGRGWQRMLPY
jgi:iron complex transport system substrate-binding protein